MGSLNSVLQDQQLQRLTLESTEEEVEVEVSEEAEEGLLTYLPQCASGECAIIVESKQRVIVYTANGISFYSNVEEWGIRGKRFYFKHKLPFVVGMLRKHTKMSSRLL